MLDTAQEKTEKKQKSFEKTLIIYISFDIGVA